jgi:hypothetical protein
VKRRLFTTLSALSLLLGVAVVVLWVRSYWDADFVGWSDQRRFFGALSMGGVLRFEHGSYGAGRAGWNGVSYPTPEGGLWGEVTARTRRGGALRNWGLAYARIDYRLDGTMVRHALYVPHWLAAAVMTVLPVLTIRARRRRRDSSICTTCGYDLRATPDRCPECGATAPAGGHK